MRNVPNFCCLFQISKLKIFQDAYKNIYFSFLLNLPESDCIFHSPIYFEQIGIEKTIRKKNLISIDLT